MAETNPSVSIDELLKLQRETFDYFLNEVNLENGLILDKTADDWPSSIAATGLALGCYPVAVERGYMAREDAVARTLATLRFFWNSPQGPEPDATGYRGFYYHFLDMQTGRPVENPAARYNVTGKFFRSLQNPNGAHTWHSMAFSPVTGLVYIPIHMSNFVYGHDPAFKPGLLKTNTGVDFSGKRVGVIGTGSSAIQAIPILAEQARDLVVFQRTPNYSIPANNYPLDPAEQAAVKADYAGLRERNRKMAAATGSRVKWNPGSVLDATPEERERLRVALLEKGPQGLLEAMQKTKPLGRLRTPDSIGYDLKYAVQNPREDGSTRVVLGTDRPIGFWEAVNRPRTIDYPFTVIELRIGPDGKGEGKMSLATKITYEPSSKSLVLENWESQPVMLNQVQMRPRSAH